MSEPSNNRRAEPRVPLSIVGIEIGHLCGTGRVFNVSETGLRIEDCPLRPQIGKRARVNFALSPDHEPFTFEAEVVRHTETGGFAVAFIAVDPRFRTLIGSLAEQVQCLPDLTESGRSSKPESPS